MPQSTSLASLAMLQQTSWALKDSFGELFRAHEGWGRKLNHVRTLYEVLEMKNKQPEGDLIYPVSSEKNDNKGGMGIEFR